MKLEDKIALRHQVVMYANNEFDWLTKIIYKCKKGHPKNILNSKEILEWNYMIKEIIKIGTTNFEIKTKSLKIELYLLNPLIPKPTITIVEEPKVLEPYDTRFSVKTILDVVKNSSELQEYVKIEKDRINKILNFKPHDLGFVYDYDTKEYLHVRQEKLRKIYTPIPDRGPIWKKFIKEFPYIAGGKCGKEYWDGINNLSELNKIGAKSCLIPIEYSLCNKYVKLRNIYDRIKPFWTQCELVNNKSIKHLLLVPLKKDL